jgi:hypothetical protein
MRDMFKSHLVAHGNEQGERLNMDCSALGCLGAYMQRRNLM